MKEKIQNASVPLNAFSKTLCTTSQFILPFINLRLTHEERSRVDLKQHILRCYQARQPFAHLAESVKVHFITPSETIAALSVKEVLPKFLEYIKADVLVAYTHS